MTGSEQTRLELELLDSGLVGEREWAQAVDAARDRGLTPWEVLGESGVSERELYTHVASAYSLPLAQVDQLFGQIDFNVARSVPRRYQERKRVLPFARVDGTLKVAACDPEPRVVDLADAFDAERVELRLVTPTDFRRLRWAVELGELGRAPVPSTAVLGDDLRNLDPTVESRHVSLLHAILVDAVGDRASDVHLERYADRVRLRVRVDGDLHDVDHYGLREADFLGVVNVLKVRARIDISERRLPQGGRFSERIGGRDFDLRVQTSPSLHGEVSVIRLLPQSRELFSIESLGFSSHLEQLYRRALSSPSGLVLLVGPTGCGKSTTLYAGLQLLSRQTARKVITVEDPIEYALENVQQTQVHPEIGYSFSGAVRSLVRQDPDVIFIGEIRDSETALEALRASQTGHLVLSTLHANDAVDAVQRLYDLGMHPNSISAELLAVFAQRLVKRLCPACRTEQAPDPELVRELFPKGLPDGLGSMGAAGCERCNGRGTYGRIAAAEHLSTTRDFRIAVSRQLPLDELRSVAASAGLRPLRDHALELVRQGTIALNDLPAVFPREQLQPR